MPRATPCRAALACSTAITAPATTRTPAGSPPRCSATWSDRPQGRGDMADELVGYLAPEGFLPQLQEELGSDAREIYGNLVLAPRSEEHTSELQSRLHLVCR